MNNQRTFRDREILSSAQQKGGLAVFFSFFRLSGPGWLQSAITLGGGSLIGALYLGVLGGTSMLWLQLVAIVIGVIMLSAISYVTLSTRVRPYSAINEYVNPVLGVAWLTATILANMIWIMPQFALCYDALDNNLLVGVDYDFSQDRAQLWISMAIALAGLVIVLMSFNPGWVSKLFDLILKLIVAMIVVCFVAVVYWLATDGAIHWPDVWAGFIPNLNTWNEPAPAIQEILAGLNPSQLDYWKNQIVAKQQESMVTVTATAVGLNMTFLLPYSMLARGWDKPFRGLARFDLITGMAIPYIVVTTCIVIASAHAFHAKADDRLLSTDPAIVQTSTLFQSVKGIAEKRFNTVKTPEEVTALNANLIEARAAYQRTLESEVKGGEDVRKKYLEQRQDEIITADVEKDRKIAEFLVSLDASERKIMPTLVKPNADQFAATLTPLLGEENQEYAHWIFGLGAFGMGFSTIVILSLINGYAFAEMFGQYHNPMFRTFGALAALAVGVFWFEIWAGESRTYLGIVASTFAAILLPIAYLSFFLLMNSRKLLGSEKPTGGRMAIWNFLMAIGVLGATVQAVAAIQTKLSSDQGAYVLGGVAVFLLLALIGFSAKPRSHSSSPEQS